MKVLILLSFLAFSAIQAADPEVENGMFNAVFNYLKSQPVLLKEEQRQVSIKVLIFSSVFNRSSRRKRGMASNPLFIIPVFSLHFPKELSYGYFPKEFSHFLQT